MKVLVPYRSGLMVVWFLRDRSAVRDVLKTEALLRLMSCLPSTSS